MQRVAARVAQPAVSSLRSCLKKADAALPKKRKTVMFAKTAKKRVYELQVGEKVPWLAKNKEEYELFEGEIAWEDWKARLGVNYMDKKKLKKWVREEQERDRKYNEAFLPLDLELIGVSLGSVVAEGLETARWKVFEHGKLRFLSPRVHSR